MILEPDEMLINNFPKRENKKVTRQEMIEILLSEKISGLTEKRGKLYKNGRKMTDREIVEFYLNKKEINQKLELWAFKFLIIFSVFSLIYLIFFINNLLN